MSGRTFFMIRNIRSVMTTALSPCRAKERIGASMTYILGGRGVFRVNEFFGIFSSFSGVAEYNAYCAQVEQHRGNNREEGTSSHFETDSLREALPSFRERSEASSTSYQGASVDSPTSERTSNRNPHRRSTLDQLRRFLSRSSSTRHSHEPEQPESQDYLPARPASPEPAPPHSSSPEYEWPHQTWPQSEASSYADPWFPQHLPDYAPAYSHTPEYEPQQPWSNHEPETSYTASWPQHDPFEIPSYSYVPEYLRPHQPPSHNETNSFHADAWSITDALFGPSVIYQPHPEFVPAPPYQPQPEFHVAPPLAQSVEVPALLNGNALFNQNGGICKPTALANLDLFFSRIHGIDNIPLRKDRSGAYRYQERGLSSGNADESVREIAKSHRSRQGEVLEAKRLVRTARDMAYKVKVIEPGNLDHFRQLVLANLSARQPLLTFFAVDGDGMPTRDYNDYNEHACLVVGVSQSRDTLTVAHYAQLFHDVPMATMFASMNSLPSTRGREIWLLDPSSAERSSSAYKKYYLTSENSSYPGSHIRKSIEPREGSGFKNKVFIVRPDLSKSRWQR